MMPFAIHPVASGHRLSFDGTAALAGLRLDQLAAADYSLNVTHCTFSV